MSKISKIIVAVISVTLVSCAAAAPIAMTALEATAPMAAEARADLVFQRTGKPIDKTTAGCFVMERGYGDENDEGWQVIHCQGKAVSE